MVRTLTCILIEVLLSNYIMFETNIFIEMVISVAVACKSMVKMIVYKGKPKFINSKRQKSETAMVHINKT